jgi:hypothetical protein
MTHITEPRVIGNHADMGPSTVAPAEQPGQSENSFTALTVTDVLRAGRRRRTRRRSDGEGGATTPDGQGRQ